MRKSHMCHTYFTSGTTPKYYLGHHTLNSIVKKSTLYYIKTSTVLQYICLLIPTA